MYRNADSLSCTPETKITLCKLPEFKLETLKKRERETFEGNSDKDFFLANFSPAPEACLGPLCTPPCKWGLARTLLCHLTRGPPPVSAHPTPAGAPHPDHSQLTSDLQGCCHQSPASRCVCKGDAARITPPTFP